MGADRSPVVGLLAGVVVVDDLVVAFRDDGQVRRVEPEHGKERPPLGHGTLDEVERPRHDDR